MNERIRDLQIQAFAECKTFEDDKIRTDEVFERFAELIVRDCASICELNGQSYKHSFTPMKARLAESTSVYCGELIKRHFGVEE